MAATKKGRGLDEFRAAYDKSQIIPKKIKSALAELGESWEHEGEFVKRCGLSQTDFGAYKELYAAHHVVEVIVKGSRRRVWAGTRSFAAKLRAIVERE